ncbi:MAG: hypothetical protein ACNA70_02565 [Brevefilum sp.]
MQIFNVGVLELLFILILVFLVLGPQKTVKAARDVGAWIRKMAKSPLWREVLNTSNEIRDLPKRIMDDAELQQMISELDLSTREINETLERTQSDTKTNLANLEDQISLDVDPQSTPHQKANDDDKPIQRA